MEDSCICQKQGLKDANGSVAITTAPLDCHLSGGYHGSCSFNLPTAVEHMSINYTKWGTSFTDRLIFSKMHMHRVTVLSKPKWWDQNQNWQPPKKSKDIQPHLCVRLILCVFTLPHMLIKVTPIIQGRKGAKQRIRGRLSAVLVHGVIRAGRPHPLCQQTVKHCNYSPMVTTGSLCWETIK